ncbi:MAG: NfeD family protein [Verrucomicrobiota bacterium]
MRSLICAFIFVLAFNLNTEIHSSLLAQDSLEQSTPEQSDETQVLDIAGTSPSDGTDKKLIYILPMKDEIQQAMTYVIRRGMKDAIDNKADAIVLHMDTPGGRVDITMELIEIIRKFTPKDQTYTFIDSNAISAGAFISAATKNIYMSPSAVIGAAAPIMMTGEDIPETMMKKQVSALRAMVRASCQENGHNSDVFEAMIDFDKGLTIDGQVIEEEGNLLTITASEAKTTYGNPPKPLVSKGTYENLDDFLKATFGENVETVTVEASGFEQLSRFIVALSPFLIAGAFLLGYIEFQSPGFGIFGIIAVILALTFFFGHYVAGLTGHETLFILVLGIALIGIELFILPGTIIPGILGIVCVFVSLLLTMVDYYPVNDPTGGFSLPVITADQLEKPMTNLALSVVYILIGIWILAKILPRTPLFKALVVEGSQEMPIIESISSLQVNHTGTAKTPLRPSGTADFGDGPVDVITDGIFIDADSPIRISEIEGNKIVVEKIAD